MRLVSDPTSFTCITKAILLDYHDETRKGLQKETRQEIWLRICHAYHNDYKQMMDFGRFLSKVAEEKKKFKTKQEVEVSPRERKNELNFVSKDGELKFLSLGNLNN